MKSEWIDIEATGGGRYGAYLSLPPAGKGPGLVLFAEIFGTNAHIRAVADQYALDGFVVLAPDLFWRDAPRVELGYVGADRDRALSLMKAQDPKALAADILTTTAALRARSEVTGKVGAFGYCMGGRLAYIAAATAGVDAASCFYGGGIHDNLQHVPAIRCPIQFHYAENDAAIPLAAVDKVRAAFAARDDKGANAEFYVYAGAQHGFNCWERASYDAPSAATAHARTLGFFSQHLFPARG